MSQKRKEIFIPDDTDYFFKLGKVKYTDAHPPLEEHIHKNMFEIVYVIKGHQTYFIDNNKYEVTGNSIFIVCENENHGTKNIPEEKSEIYYVIFDLEKMCNHFKIFTDIELENLKHFFRNLKERVFYLPGNNANRLEYLFDVLKNNTKYKLTKASNIISSFFLDIIKAHSSNKKIKDPTIEYAINYIEKNITENINICNLSSMCNLSQTRFKVNFKLFTGIPPGEYILRKKIDYAKNILLEEKNKSITEIAHSLSFSSSQYFSVVFKRFTYKSPSQFRRENR